MKGRKQTIPNYYYRQKAIAEYRGYVEMPTSIWIIENNEVTPPKEDGLLGKILNSHNLNKAYLRKESHGVIKWTSEYFAII